MRTLIFLFLLIGSYSFADTKILIIGSGKSFSEGAGADSQDPVKLEQVATELRKMLKEAGKDAKVVVDEYYTTKQIDTAIGGRGTVWKLHYHRYSLAQYYFWPEGREKRLKNLQGKDGNKWDYIVLIDDPYLSINMPGIYAEGVKLLTKTIEKGKAKPILFLQWPRKSTKVSQKVVNEITYRVADGLDIKVAAAGYIWENLKDSDKTEANAPKVGAAGIFHAIYSKSKKPGEETLAYRMRSASRKAKKEDHYKGDYKGQNPFTSKQVSKRYVRGHHTGTSTERGLTGQLKKVIGQTSVYFNQGKTKGIDFNYGRANSAFEANKKYKVDPSKFDRSYGIVMQDHGNTAYMTMLYGIDKRSFHPKYRIDDGTDMGIAHDMIRQNEVAKDIRTIPGRLISAKIMDYDPEMIPVKRKGDRWHQQGHCLMAQAAYVYATLSGRYPINIKDMKSKSFMMCKIGYDTAWTMSTLQARSPGFVVRPSDIKTVALKSGQEETMTIFFANKPEENVSVKVMVDGKVKKTLKFSKSSYSRAQTFKFKGTGKESVVTFETKSDDRVFDGLTDSWKYGAAK